MENRIDLKIENNIAHAHLIRGDKMNALDAEMMDALIECGERIKADRSIRAVVLSGEGRAFCAGLDMGNFAKMAEGGNAGVTEGKKSQNLAERTHGLANRPQKVAFTWREIEVPVIAAAQGFALGGGDLTDGGGDAVEGLLWIVLQGQTPVGCVVVPPSQEAVARRGGNAGYCLVRACIGVALLEIGVSEDDRALVLFYEGARTQPKVGVGGSAVGDREGGAVGGRDDWSAERALAQDVIKCLRCLLAE